MLARLSAHCPNFWEVLVKVMLGVTVLLIMACKEGVGSEGSWKPLPRSPFQGSHGGGRG